MTDTSNLILIGPEVMAVRASQQQVEETHIKWFVGVAPEYDYDGSGRVVFGTLHGAGVDGIAEVEVACMMRYPAERDSGVEDFIETLASSDALETLWDVARIAFRAIAATTNLSVQPPAKAPEAQVSQLVRAELEEENASGAAAEDVQPG